MYKQKKKIKLDHSKKNPPYCSNVMGKGSSQQTYPSLKQTHHVLVVVKVLDGLLGTADFIIVSLGGYVEVVERERPEGCEETAVDVVPHLGQTERLGGFY